MGVTFVYRCHYCGPSEKLVKRFEEDASVLAWFQNRWHRLADTDVRRTLELLREELGVAPNGLGLFHAVAEMDLAAPQSMTELRRLIREMCYVTDFGADDEHSLQALTDDDLEMAWFFFDDVYAAQNGRRLEFLLHADWRLPPDSPGEAPTAAAFHSDEAVKQLPAGDRTGTTWLAVLAYYDSMNLIDLAEEGPWLIPGVRVADLPRYFANAPPAPAWPLAPREFTALRAVMLANPPDASERERSFLAELRADPSDDDLWLVYGDWLQETRHERPAKLLLERAFRYGAACDLIDDKRQKLLAGLDLEKSHQLLAETPRREGTLDEPRIAISDHLAQTALQVYQWGERKMYHQWILFDDVWASQYPDLANGILRFARRWDIPG